MTSDAPPRRPVGRPRDEGKGARMLDAAWSLFLERGVEGVSMETVAARAGVSKSTLYAGFPDRAALFEAVMLREMERIEAQQALGGASDASSTLAETLTAFGMGIMTFLAGDTAVAFYGPLSAEIRRRPDLSEAFWRLGPGRTRANLTSLLADAASRGEIVADDPQAAAEALFGLWQGFSNLALVREGGAERVRASVAERVARGTAMFLAAHST